MKWGVLWVLKIQKKRHDNNYDNYGLDHAHPFDKSSRTLLLYRYLKNNKYPICSNKKTARSPFKNCFSDTPL